MLISLPARTRQRVGSAALALLAAALIEAGWLGAAAQGLPASLGHRQPTAADAAGEPTEKKTPVSPQEAAMERAVNNFCRGCSPIIPVASVPRYNPAVACDSGSGEEKDRCRRDEEVARNNLTKQWPQFTAQGRSNWVQTNEIGGRPSYVQLIICLKATQIAPTLPESR